MTKDTKAQLKYLKDLEKKKLVAPLGDVWEPPKEEEWRAAIKNIRHRLDQLEEILEIQESRLRADE